MPQPDADFRRAFFRQVTYHALDPDDKRYVPLYTEGELAAIEGDPVERMAFSIESIPEETVQLFSGFRGTGKTTELKRLAKRLAGAGYLVAAIDVDEYLNL